MKRVSLWNTSSLHSGTTGTSMCSLWDVLGESHSFFSDTICCFAVQVISWCPVALASAASLNLHGGCRVSLKTNQAEITSLRSGMFAWVLAHTLSEEGACVELTKLRHLLHVEKLTQELLNSRSFWSDDSPQEMWFCPGSHWKELWKIRL